MKTKAEKERFYINKLKKASMIHLNTPPSSNILQRTEQINSASGGKSVSSLGIFNSESSWPENSEMKKYWDVLGGIIENQQTPIAIDSRTGYFMTKKLSVPEFLQNKSPFL